jgi:hypothetical protein
MHRRRIFGLGLTLAMTIVGATWAHQSTKSIAIQAVDVGSVSTNWIPTTEGSRRLVGLCLLAMTGTTVVLRARRPRTI